MQTLFIVVGEFAEAELKAHSYPLLIDEYEPDTFDAVKHRIQQRYSNGGNKLVNIKLSDLNEINNYADIFGNVKPAKVSKKLLQHLKPSVEEDYQFLLELENLKAIIEKVKSGAVRADNAADLYNFRFRSLHPLLDFHAEELNDLSEAFKKAYDGSALVTCVTSDVAHTRRAQRSTRTKRDTQQPDSEKYNIAKAYSEDYPAVFNIILWFGVVFTFSLLAIVYFIMDMDPGRDSIIYRMTSTRMKKDN
ncbi:hypothetical protein EVAR_3014_1 [Eumeta japonica]|uniref:Renin receptor n=1 Tax=Eumeta variegata TaxID=151549 RepID=A0A4C1SU97_EUMVA|nr:hypothetical protein EVAR_3014_1 [Eumeta japonica]